MSSTPVNTHLPRDIDPRKFANQGITLAGSIALDALPRLTELVATAEGEINVVLAFDIDEQGFKVVNGDIAGSLALTCQRCLDPVVVPLQAALHVAVVWDEDAAKALPRTLDPWIVGEGVTDIYQIVEEEILLSLPMVAYHDEPCIETLQFQGDDVVAEDIEPADNPFKVLEQLKGSPKS